MIEMDGQNIRDKVYEVCRDYLGGSWKKVTPNDIIIEPISGGLVNSLSKVSLPDNFDLIAEEPRFVMFKLFSDLGLMDKGQFGIMTENTIAVLLGESTLAPKVYGIFDGGRLDEFILSRTLTSEDIRNPTILSAVSRNLARLHRETPPLSKNPDQYYKKMEDMLENTLKDIPSQIKNDPRKQEIWDKLLAINPHDEFQWLMKRKNLINSPIVFCHNDVTRNNILLLDDPHENLVQFIDFELSGYNFRGYDFANLFCSFCIEILPHSPYIIMNMDNFPSLYWQKFVCRTYLTEYHKDNNTTKLNIEEEEKSILEEFKIFNLILFFFWLMLTLFSPRKLKIKLDWLYLSNKLLDYYHDKKIEYLSSK